MRNHRLVPHIPRPFHSLPHNSSRYRQHSRLRSFLMRSLVLTLGPQQVDLMIDEWVTNNTIGGFIATVVYDQDIVWSKGYGSANVFAPGTPPPTLDN